ncbi:S-adenosyl-L-methionine-dependent methyltransferase [Basidiobolus meristosporus CBS 931.73]|uniref:S-adenosyl-L-methionine-dependent methyltransferase n=1 Tax=Basidiobolus meristosporus CBS 931.73 TaxID=1314790 RepID=A0A1Y1YJE2_9FUNG|nr:S-adenosyl-L-methionine-dependent methyltransferase [Basidiobolus meristosporus CBS 931.73]|eukprot:ORX98147.1 S-adenosyl-L-methionine-dependent methyltransferase [Basidiobolus meristosporus CBS 931.73]
MKSHPFYPSLLTLNRKNEGLKVLDLGCCFGADLRKLIIDGFSGENLTGLDISADFIQLGQELFKDEETSGLKFVVADILSDEWPEKVAGLQFDVIYLGSFLHLFDRPQQETILRRVSQLLKENGVLFGKNLGSGGVESTVDLKVGQVFLCTPDLFAKNLSSLGFGDIDVVAVPKEQLEDFQGGDPVGLDHPFLIYTAVKNGNPESQRNEPIAKTESSHPWPSPHHASSSIN